jgi:hypothetical protein
MNDLSFAASPVPDDLMRLDPDDSLMAEGPPSDAAALAHLPPPDTKRWVASRKSSVVAAVQEGLLTVEQACSRYQLSAEEFSSWTRLVELYGTGGLRVTRLRSFRRQAAGHCGAVAG